jgi:hypothetical protein
MIRQVGIMGGSFEFRDKNFPIVDPSDIAAVAAKELTSLNFSGHSSIYVASDETDTNEIASVIGHAIGKPGLKWVKFDEAQVFESMKSVGFSEQSTKEFIEGFKAFEKGKITEEYWNRPRNLF